MDCDREYYCSEDSDECDECPLYNSLHCLLMREKVFSYERGKVYSLINEKNVFISFDEYKIDLSKKAFVSTNQISSLTQ